MKSEAIIVERRQRARNGILAEIENITYSALRKYEVGTEQLQSSESEKSA
jgi:hypothetical protein